MSWILEQIGVLLVILLVLTLIIALIAPFETLGWWAGWSHGGLQVSPPPEPEPAADTQPPAHTLVYLTGVGGFSGDFLRPDEARFVERLSGRMGGALVVHDVFPYSATNNPLDGDRVLASMWRWLQKHREKTPNSIYDVLVILRNTLQVGVSADPRYGPLYNSGVAHEIVRSLVRQGYRTDSGQPIYLIGYSGGAQISIGAAPFLAEAIEAPIRVIALGGVMSSDRGMAAVDQLYSLPGSKDIMPLLGLILYPGRWPLLATSSWNNARRDGRITTIEPGPMTHFGSKDYFSATALLENGQPHVERTVSLIEQIVTDAPRASSQ